MPSFPSVVRSKLPNTGTTIFTTMSAMSSEYDAINLSQGFPDFPCSDRLIDLVYQKMKEGYNQYAPMQGVPALRHALANKIELIYSVRYDPETEITITAGGTQAIYSAISALVNDGDEVILFTPAYDCYVPAIELNGGRPISIQLTPPEYSINWEDVKKVISQKTRMIIINTPHNPSGSVLGKDDLDQLEKLTKDTEIVILSDEVYEHIIFDQLKHRSVMGRPLLAARSFAVFSFGKTFHATGWKLGYCVGPENLMKEFRRVHQFQVFCANTPIQTALAEYLEHPEEYEYLSKFYEEKRDIFLDSVKDSRFSFVPSRGTYFQLLGYSQITDERDVDFAVRVTQEHRVGCIPVSVFYYKETDHKVLRFCFAKSEDTLKRAAERLCRI